MLSVLNDLIYTLVILIILSAKSYNGFMHRNNNKLSNRITFLGFTAPPAKITLFYIRGNDFIGNRMRLRTGLTEKENDIDFLLESFELLHRKSPKVLLRELLKDWWEKFPLKFSEQKGDVTVIIQSIYGSGFVDEETLIDREQLLELVSTLRHQQQQQQQQQYEAVEEEVELKCSTQNEIDESSLKDVFDQLSRGGEKILLDTFKAWEVLTHLIESGYVSEQQVNLFISDSLANDDTEQGLDYDHFISLVHRIDAVASTAIHPDDGPRNSGGGGGVGEIKESMLKEFFDQLRGDCLRISVNSIREWVVIRNLISSSEVITAAYVESLLEVIVGVTGSTVEDASSLDFAQFVELAHRLDVAMRHHAISESDVKVVDEEAVRVEDSLLKAVFDQLSDGENTVPVKNIKAWDVIRHLIQSKMIAMEAIDSFIHDLLIEPDHALQSIDDAEFNYGQFVELAHKIDGATLHVSGHGIIDEDEAMSDGEIEGGVEEVLLRNAFTHLCVDGQTSVSVDSIKEWDVISHLIFSGALTAREVDAFIEELLGVESEGGLSYTQFVWLAHRIDEATHSVDKNISSSDSFEAGKREDESGSESADGTTVDDQLFVDLFSELSGNTQSISVDSFLSWSVIKRVVESRLLSRGAIDTMIREVLLGDGMAALDFKHFVELMHRIDEATSTSTGNAFASAEEGESSSGSSSGGGGSGDDLRDDTVRVVEPFPTGLEENLRSVYDQLRSGSTIPTSAAITLKILRDWDLINHLIAIGSLQSDDLERIVRDLFCGRGEGDGETPDDENEVDFFQFVEFAHRINNATQQ